MMRWLNQFQLLLWKNYLLQKRRVFVTVIEIALPAFFALILILIRQRVDATPVHNATTWSAFPAGQITWICPILNICPLDYWKVYYAPDNNLTERVMKNMLKYLGTPQRSHIQSVIGFDTEEDLVKDFMIKFENSSRGGSIFSFCDILGGIIFNISSDESTFPLRIQYKIRLPYTPRTSSGTFHLDPNMDDTSWRTEFMFPLYQTVGPRANYSKFSNDPGYMQEGFLELQNAIDQSIMHELNPTKDLTTMSPDLKRFPYPPYNNDLFVLVLQNQFPFIIMLSFIFSALQIVKDLVHEKEKRLKESMKMMGLSGWLHWLAWFVKYFLFLLIDVIIMVTLFTINTGAHGSIIGYSSWSVLFVFLLLYAIATINFCFAVSVFFSKANSGAAAGGILFFLSYLPYVFLQKRYNILSTSAKISTCLFSNVAMAYGAQVIGMFEGTGAGIQWSNINQGSSVDDSFTMIWVFIMLIVDSVVYALIAWYMEAVWPGEYGIPQPWYFPFMRSYWCQSTVKQCDDFDPERTPLLSSNINHSEFIESEPVGLKAGIRIKRLRKVFKVDGKEKVAVEGMTLNMYEGQITVLLGHNGAGKTTTMSMLTGFFPPTSGTALVNGYDITTDIAGVRQSLGLCPQHNVLFDILTVEEHLEFFAKLKGCPSGEVKEEIDTILETLELENKRHVQTKLLSGGMKRKLSVGIALIGGSKVVIMDEPTSGMDPDARRHTWDILQRHRAGRTMILTTHFMDEADILGDRIAIMAEGVIQCCGTPLFLKNKYGAGYHLVMVKQPDCDVDEVMSLVQKHIPDATIENDFSLELSFILPHESKADFSSLFDEIEQRKSELKIASYGASVTTMEEVFLKVGDASQVKELRPSSLSSSYSTLSGIGSCPAPILPLLTRNEGCTLYLQQFHAMFLKRILHTGRNWLITVTQLLIPFFFTLIMLIVLRTLPHPEDSPPLVLDMSHFGKNHILYSEGVVQTELKHNLSKLYSSQFDHKLCMLEYVNLTTKKSMDDWLVKIGEKGVASYSAHYLIAMELGNTGKQLRPTGFFNAEGYHTAPMTLNAVDNMLLKYTANSSYSLITINHPFPRTVQNKISDQLMKGFEGFSIAINVVFGMSFLASSFVLFLIKERTIKAKHCQFVSGAQSWIFWAATFYWDMINYIIPCILLMLTFVGFSVHAYVDDGRFLDIMLLFVLYGWSMLPFMYLLSFLFSIPSSGFVWLSMFNIFSGIATVLAVEILMIPGLKTENIAKGLEWIFLVILPNFCLGKGLTDFYNNNQFLEICSNSVIQLACNNNQTNPCCKDNCGDQCLDYTDNYLGWERGGIGRHLIFLTCQGALYFVLLFIIESQVLQRLWYVLRPRTVQSVSEVDPDAIIQEDSDVAAERRRITLTSMERLLHSETLILQELTKYYGNLLAVDRLSLGIQKGECFGLLGVNGAGKTTTFKMLTGDEIVSSGDAFLKRYSIRKDIKKVRQQLGYCPQFDGLIDQLTGRENLIMYARLRGVPEKDIPEVVDVMIDRLLLGRYADRLVKTYSGGNKRKLSTAIALVGDPPIVFLDEPSTGMDPTARRMLWDTLSEIRAYGRTLILTSHSMEECDALCTRLAIMVNGQFKCLGSPQHLKSKFGAGYTLIIKVSPMAGTNEPDTRPLIEYIQQQFRGSILKDIHQGMLHFHITDTSLKWAELFRTMENCKELFNIEDYSISQTTLEQVFLNFARSQVPPLEASAGRCKQCSPLCCMCMCCCQGQGTIIVDAEENTSTRTPQIL